MTDDIKPGRAAQVEIKKLEWRSHAWGAEADGGRYRIEDNGTNWTDDRYWLFVNVGLLSSHRSKFATLDAAKAAAQADFEQRVRSCIESSPDLPDLSAEIERLRGRVAELATIAGQQRGRAEAAEANVARLEADLAALYDWYDRDGSVGGASAVFEEHRAAIATQNRDRQGEKE